jgi:DnaJ domain
MNPTRNPLAWPYGWKRTPNSQRNSSRFSQEYRQLSIGDAVDRVLIELNRMHAIDIIVSSNLALRNDGLPYSRAGEPDDPGVAVYWVSTYMGVNAKGKPTRYRGDTRCMAIDRYDRAADNLAAIAATLDAMRAIERHGGALIIDRVFTGFTALPEKASAPSNDWWNILDVPRDASEIAIEAAYRKLLLVHHPDKGGTHDKMAQINIARDTGLRATQKQPAA